MLCYVMLCYVVAYSFLLKQSWFSDRPFTEQLTDISFDADSIKKKLNSLKVNKSPGPDQLHPRLLKEMSGILKFPLQKLFSRCMDTGKVPKTWKIGHVTPIFKKGKIVIHRTIGL